MAAKQIDLRPDILDLYLYAGDGVQFRLVCKDGAGDPIDMNGAVEAEIRLERLTPDPPVAIFASNLVDAYLGIIILSLTGEQTAELSFHDSAVDGRFVGVWDIQWTPTGEEPRTVCQGKVECVIDVTR